GDLAVRGLRDPGRSGRTLGAADQRWGRGEPVWLAPGPVRRVLADHPVRAAAADAGPGPAPGGTDDAGHALDEEARHRGAGGGGRRRVTLVSGWAGPRCPRTGPTVPPGPAGNAARPGSRSGSPPAGTPPGHRPGRRAAPAGARVPRPAGG